MDVLEELDINVDFVLATSVDPGLFVEYLPVDIITIGKCVARNMLFPHVLGKASGMCKSYINHKFWAYNGYLLAYDGVYLMLRTQEGHYDVFSKHNPIDGISGRTNDPKNMLINFVKYNEDGAEQWEINTKFGEFNYQYGDITVAESSLDGVVKIKSGYMPANTCYNYDGEAFPEGEYTNLMTINDAPLNYYRADTSVNIEPKIVPKSIINPDLFTYGRFISHGNITLIDEPIPKPPMKIPMIRNIYDLYNQFSNL